MLKIYSKKIDFSYSFGVSPTIELLEKQAENVTRVIINPKGIQNAGVSKIIETCETFTIPMEVNQALAEKLSGSENTYAIGVFRKYATGLNAEKNHLVLANPSDMGNLGTICRTMLAFDFTDLVIIKPAADIFDPKVIRASMGAFFSVNFAYFDSFEDYQNTYKHKIYTFMSDGKSLLNKVTFEKPYALVFGNEGEGLGDEYKKVGESVRIPQSTKVDSFNLSVSVGIALYHAHVG